jgi:predicted MPP superfamily phosphohydrolase
MWPAFPEQDALLAAGALFVVVMTTLRLLQPEWWESRAVRTATFLSFGALLGGLALWAVGTQMQSVAAIRAGAGLSYAGVLVLAPGVVVLPFAALLDRVLIRLLARPLAAPSPALEPVSETPRSSPSLTLSRRSVIRAGAMSLPAAAAMTGATGLATPWQRPRIRVIPMRFEGLHPDLEGLRVLQLSDLHLGACAGLADLATSLDEAMVTQRPDLIVITGDLADDPDLIPGALELVTRARARYGAIASLGNHEYLHGIHVTRPRFEASPVPLLVSAGRTVTIGRARLFIGGADDPVHMHGDVAAMVEPSIARAASDAPPGADFRLLLCHRPEGHRPAADHGFDLTLAGHTHGGQLGFLGRSLLEKLRPGTGWWGTYARRRRDGRTSRLYTTSGFGHWFPFRVGCPTEMPVLVLERAPGPEREPSTSRRPA